MIVRCDEARSLCVLISCALFAVSCGNGTGLDDDDPLPATSGATAAIGSGLVSATTSLTEQPATIDFDVPAGAEIKQVLLYWDSPAATADDVLNVNGRAVQGELIREGRSTSRPVYRTDIAGLGIVGPGSNTLTLSRLAVGAGGQAGASVVVVYDDGESLADLQIQDGSGARQPAEEIAADGSVTHTFVVPSSDVAQPTELALLVSDGGVGAVYDVVVRAGEQVLFMGEVQPGEAYWAEQLESFDVPPGADALQITVSPRDGMAGDLWVVSTLRQQACTGTISGRVRDAAAGDMSLAGIDVRLESGGEVLATTATVEDGTYSFVGLCEGEYDVRIAAETLPEGFRRMDCPDDASDEESRCDFASTVILEGNDSNVDSAEFEFAGPCTGRVGDLLWNDLNGDGIATADEPGLFCVTVLLSLEGSDLILEETVTDADGRYEFNQLCAGAYVVMVKDETLPRDFSASPCGAGDDATRDNDCSPVTVVLDSDSGVAPTHDFGFTSACVGEISGAISRAVGGPDDPGGEPVEGVVFRILDSEGNLVAKAPSGPDGYSFRGLCPGDYRVEIDPASVPPDVIVSGCEIAGVVLEDCASVPVTIDDDGEARVMDFPVDTNCSSAIVGRVWNELNDDTIFSLVVEDGLDGVRVLLRDERGAEVLATTTNSVGDFELVGLCAGSYTLDVDTSTIPPGFGPARCVEAAADHLQATCLPASVVLSADDAETIRTDVAFESPFAGRFFTIVYDDADRDGRQGEGELGIGHARLTLSNEMGEKITTLTTRGSGSTGFEGIDTGTYVLEVDESTIPEGYSQVSCTTEPGGELESRCSPARFEIPPTDVRQFVRFGYSLPETAE